jgi:hypothetical protein
MGLGSRIRKKPIPDLGSRGQKGTGTDPIWIRHTAIFHPFRGLDSSFSQKGQNHE